ncbi:MAG: hypothetical protein WCG93_01315 [Paludibacter sp.]
MKKILAFIYKNVSFIPVFIFLCFFITYIIRCIISYPEQKQILIEMKNELNKINKFPNTIVTYEDSHAVLKKTFISVHYSASQSDEEIYGYYSRELLRNDWVLITNEKEFNWGKDLKKNGIDYKKKNYILNISFYPNRKAGDAYAIFVEEVK